MNSVTVVDNAHLLPPPISTLINKCIKCNTLPDALKIVIPVHKKDILKAGTVNEHSLKTNVINYTGNQEFHNTSFTIITAMEHSLEDIDKVLTLAKLNINDLVPASQSIYFVEDYAHNQQYKFLELNSHIMEQLKVGETLYINGDPDDNTVICTKDRTFKVLGTETSNNLLLIENLKFNNDLKTETDRNTFKVEVQCIFQDYFELYQKKPDLQKVNKMLEKTVYKGNEHEYKINQNDLLTFDELWKKSQSSKEELRKALKEMQTVTINNKIRILDFEYHFRILSFMLKLIEENSWDLDEINYEETMNALEDLFPSEVINSLFDLYAEESKIVESLPLYRYKENEICKFFAQVLLHSAGKFNLNEFLQAWQDSVPEGMVSSEEMLYGIAIINRKSVPNVVWSFKENQLSENITERFHELFEAKEKWLVPEITPYIQRLTTDKLDVNALLAKHARASKVNGIKYYSAKHAK